jgi:hypothetical protein
VCPFSTSKSFAALRETFSNAYPEKEEANKKTEQIVVDIFILLLKLFYQFFLPNKKLRMPHLS